MLNLQVADNADLWWHPRDPNQKALFNSTVKLTEPFFQEIIKSPVPIDLRVLKVIKQSPMALDIYIWLTYRMSYLRKQTKIPWQALQAQFGANYPMTAQGTRDFKKNFLLHLKKIVLLYPAAHVENMETGLLLKPSKPHIRKLTK